MAAPKQACGSTSKAIYAMHAGGWPTNFGRLRETKDLSASSRIGNSAHRRFQDIQENFWKDQAKFGSRRLRNYHANHAIFLRVMTHLKVLKVHIPPRARISQAAKQQTPTRGQAIFLWGVPSD
jgi:hypothetical protein